MNYTLVNEYHENAMRLQSVGIVKGTKAIEVKVGDKLMWNFGYVYEVNRIIRQTPKFLIIEEKSLETGECFERRLKKDRLICILDK